MKENCVQLFKQVQHFFCNKFTQITDLGANANPSACQALDLI